MVHWMTTLRYLNDLQREAEAMADELHSAGMRLGRMLNEIHELTEKINRGEEPEQVQSPCPVTVITHQERGSTDGS